MSIIIDMAVAFVIIFLSLILLEIYLDWYAKIALADLFDSEE